MLMWRTVPLILLLAALGAAFACGGAAADDDAEIRGLIDRFFAAHVKEDLEGLLALFEAPSAQLRPATRLRFTADDRAFSGLRISHMQVTGERASLRAHVDEERVDARTRM